MAWSKHKYQKLLAALKEMGIDIMEIETRIYHTGNGKTENTLKLVLLPEYIDGCCIRNPMPQEPPPPATRLVSYLDQTTGNTVLGEFPIIYQLGTDTNINRLGSINLLVDAVIQNLDNVQRTLLNFCSLL